MVSVASSAAPRVTASTSSISSRLPPFMSELLLPLCTTFLPLSSQGLILGAASAVMMITNHLFSHHIQFFYNELLLTWSTNFARHKVFYLFFIIYHRYILLSIWFIPYIRKICVLSALIYNCSHDMCAGKTEVIINTLWIVRYLQQLVYSFTLLFRLCYYSKDLLFCFVNNKHVKEF